MGSGFRPLGAVGGEAELPAVNGHATARAIARIYGALACGGTLDGVRVLTGDAIAAASAEHSHGNDAVLAVPTRFGLGFMLSQPALSDASFGPNPGAFGHPGAGGSLGFADPVAALGAQGQDVSRAFGQTNTTLAVIATNVRLSKSAITRVAQMAQDGLARAIRPVHTMIDGDVVFEDGNVGIGANLLGQGVLHCEACGIGNVDDSAGTVAAFAGQVIA